MVLKVDCAINTEHRKKKEELADGQLKCKDLLTIEHVNARYLLENLPEIKLVASERNTDVLCVSETWLLPHIPDSHVHSSCYHV